jgi:hypothetical protein
MSPPVRHLNPHQLLPSYAKATHRAAHRKFYLAVVKGQDVTLNSRQVFWRAHDAEKHAVSILERWRRLYDAMLIENLKKLPAYRRPSWLVRIWRRMVAWAQQRIEREVPK